MWACGRYVSAGGCDVMTASTSSTYYTLTVCKVLVVRHDQLFHSLHLLQLGMHAYVFGRLSAKWNKLIRLSDVRAVGYTSGGQYFVLHISKKRKHGKSDKMKSLLFKADSQEMAQVWVAKIEECISELDLSVLEYM